MAPGIDTAMLVAGMAEPEKQLGISAFSRRHQYGPGKLGRAALHTARGIQGTATEPDVET